LAHEALAVTEMWSKMRGGASASAAARAARRIVGIACDNLEVPVKKADHGKHEHFEPAKNR
jgi:hypothetical protein